MGRNVGRLQNNRLTLRVWDQACSSPPVSQHRLCTHHCRLPHSTAALVLPLPYPCARKTRVTLLQTAANARSS